LCPSLAWANQKANLPSTFLHASAAKASICNFQLPANKTDYTTQIVKHELVCGLHDPLIQEQVLAHSATEEGMDYDTTLKLIEANESRKQDANSLSRSTSSGLNRLSDYQATKKKKTPGERLHH
jgi:hypothetical protein